ncbi:MAG TPA: class I SAM-dependent methyltransferase, partial [Thermomicrobiales bacterium]|nr:class I SAM-dependent methyltransferase [Thermomicrobiales bacterium]
RGQPLALVLEKVACQSRADQAGPVRLIPTACGILRKRIDRVGIDRPYLTGTRMEGPVVDTDIRDGQYRDPVNLGARIDLHQRFSTNGQGWFTWLGEQLDLANAADVLELGCGEGGFWVANADRVPRSTTLMLTDFSPGMLAATRGRLHPILRGARFAVVDAQAIPFADASFDVVIANHMLYHVPDLHRALREIRRVLRPDGRLHAATNGERHLTELGALIRAVGLDAERLGIHDAFSLERGAAALNRHFVQIERRDYDDALVVTDPEAIVRYVTSTVGAMRIDGDQVEELRRLVTDSIASEGAFRITKSTGLFIASGTLDSI